MLSYANLVLIRGLPGSGKSTLAAQLTTHLHVEADMYFYGPNRSFDPNQIAQAYAWCEATTRLALEEGYSVVVSNCFLRLSDLSVYIEMADTLGLNYEIIEAQGQFNNIHDVQPEQVERMRTQWEPLDDCRFNTTPHNYCRIHEGMGRQACSADRASRLR